MNKTEGFDYKEFEKDALAKLKQGVSLEGENGILAPAVRSFFSYGQLYSLFWRCKLQAAENFYSFANFIFSPLSSTII